MHKCTFPVRAGHLLATGSMERAGAAQDTLKRKKHSRAGKFGELTFANGIVNGFLIVCTFIDFHRKLFFLLILPGFQDIDNKLLMMSRNILTGNYEENISRHFPLKVRIRRNEKKVLLNIEIFLRE